VVLTSPVARAICTDKIVNNAEASVTQTLVLIPAGRRRTLRSKPITAPRKDAQSSR
jgi:hypothetical protein